MFQLPETTPCRCTNANPRVEFHGEEQHRAIDLTFEVKGENTLLDAIAPGLRAHHYCNRAADAQQQALPDVAIPLPNLRFPQLPETVRWDQPKARGYRWIWDWGRDEQHVDFSDAALGALSYTLHEGGSVEVKFSVSYNGDELADNALFGELCGLAAMGEVHIQLFAPPELVPVKKGWRSGVADAPASSDNGAPLLEPGPGDDDRDDDDAGQGPVDGFAEGSPEAALLDSVQNEGEADPFPASKPKRGRGKRAAAGAPLQ
jgi:hypothetical protein